MEINENVKKLLYSKNTEDQAIGISLVDIDPETNLEWKRYLYEAADSGAVELVYDVMGREGIPPTGYNINNWILKKKK